MKKKRGMRSKMVQTEKNVCITLRDWFIRYNVNVWLNSGDNKFTTLLTQKKPDMIIYSPTINQYIAIEVKCGNVSKEVYDSSKIIDYWQMYTDGKIKYIIAGKEIYISSFACASLYSMFGHLFQEEEVILLNSICDKWQIINKERKIEPYTEYTKSQYFIRNLWANWRRVRTKEKSSGMGVILCDDLNNVKPTGIISQPILFDQQYELIKGKYQWKVRQKWL